MIRDKIDGIKMPGTPRTILIDTDTASDDAVALIMALRHPGVTVAAITVVSGNVPLRQGVVNALYTIELSGAATPVFPGCDRPLLRAPAHAEWFHGRDGLGEMNYPVAKAKASATHAVEAIIETVRANPGIEIVTLGPLTNLALAVAREPSVGANVSRCVIMGGNPCSVGNVTPAAEYNIWCDPEAAQIVLRSGLAVELVGWQLCRGEAVLDTRDIAYVRTIGTDLANFAIDCNRVAVEAYRKQTGETGIALPDPVAMAVALEPSIVLERSTHPIEVETSSELTRGMTVVDRLNVTSNERNGELWSKDRPSQASVVWRIDIPRWKELLYKSLRR
jgi:purine nucleosidase